MLSPLSRVKLCGSCCLWPIGCNAFTLGETSFFAGVPAEKNAFYPCPSALIRGPSGNLPLRIPAQRLAPILRFFFRFSLLSLEK
jgi:hypothetical protein